jgi:hypothetical protein
MAEAEYAFSELVQHPNRVAAAVESNRRVILRRRNAPDLALCRADLHERDLTEVKGFSRLLEGLLPSVPAGDVVKVVAGALPWTRYLTPNGREQFVGELSSVLRNCVDLETFAPLATYLAEWRNTAAIQADPELRDRLTKPIEKPLGTPVTAP